MALNINNLRERIEGDTTCYYYNIEGQGEQLILEVKPQIAIYRVAKGVKGDKFLEEVAKELRTEVLQDMVHTEVCDEEFSEFLALYGISTYEYKEEDLERFKVAVRMAIKAEEPIGVIQIDKMSQDDVETIEEKKKDFIEVTLNDSFYKQCVLGVASESDDQLDFAFKTTAMSYAWTLQKILEFHGVYFPPQLKLTIIVEHNKTIWLALHKNGKIIC
jgi:uncharacterized protein YciU (UPF0263 family)